MSFKQFSLFALCIVLASLCLVACDSAKIPEIANVDEMSAKNLLSSNGLIPAIVYEYNEDVAEGCVIRTEPSIGLSVEKNSIVTIYISNGPGLTVPDVSNIDEESAKDLLLANAFFPSIIYEYSDDVKKGYVIRTEPEVGSTVEANAAINIVVSCGVFYREPKEVKITLDKAISVDSCKVYKKGDKLYIDCHNFSFTPQGTTDESLLKWYDPENTGSIQGKVWWENIYIGTTIAIVANYQEKNLSSSANQDFIIELPWSIENITAPTGIRITIQLVYNDTVCEKIIELEILWI